MDKRRALKWAGGILVEGGLLTGGFPWWALIVIGLLFLLWAEADRPAVRDRFGGWNPLRWRFGVRADESTSHNSQELNVVRVAWARDNCTAIRVRNQSTKPIDDVHLVVRKIERCYQREWIEESEEIPKGSLPVRASSLGADKPRLLAGSQTEFRFVHTVTADAVTTGVRSKLTRQHLQLRHRGDWKVVVCVKWKSNGEGNQREETLGLKWVKGAAPLVGPLGCL
jgi:hypothetical protein